MEQTRPRIRVLVADDSVIALQSICDFLEAQRDFNIVGTAFDGAHLIQETVRLQPDLVLADFKMKEMNGLQAARELRKIFPTLRVVILSGLDGPSIAEDLAQSGADAFVEKAELPDKLIPAILRLFP